ncbi:hypothetical protein HDU76_003595 [Blyttiomyces sp. JEL0837]|nr:hypothetical protein HDU76_003595 [Blyttiomyces sp. JEL0837]
MSTNAHTQQTNADFELIWNQQRTEELEHGSDSSFQDFKRHSNDGKLRKTVGFRDDPTFYGTSSHVSAAATDFLNNENEDENSISELVSGLGSVWSNDSNAKGVPNISDEGDMAIHWVTNAQNEDDGFERHQDSDDEEAISESMPEENNMDANAFEYFLRNCNSPETSWSLQNVNVKNAHIATSQPSSRDLPNSVLGQVENDLQRLQRKRESLESVRKAKTRCMTLERELFSLQTRSTVKTDIQLAGDGIQSHDDGLATEREENEVMNHVYSIKRDINKLKTLAASVVPGSGTYHEKVLAWEQRRNDETSKSANAPADNGEDSKARWDSDGLLPEVVEFQEYLVRHGGYSGGWDDLSHSAFLRLRNKYGPSNPQFLSACGSGIPGIGVDEARSHEAWYSKFIVLLEAKKAAIKLWKKRKEAREQLYEHAPLQLDSSLAENAAVTKCVQDAERQMKAKQREEAKKAIALWKEEQRIKENEKIKLEEEKKKLELEKLRKIKEYNENLRLEAARYAQLKAEQKAFEKQLHEDADKSRLKAVRDGAKAELERQMRNSLNRKNSELIAKKKLAIDKKEQEMKERQQRIQKLRETVIVDAPRDPARLYKLTKGYQARLMAPRITESEAVGNMFRAATIAKRFV